MNSEDKPQVVPWTQRDRALDKKVRALYQKHYPSWTAEARARGIWFGPKWHVGRAMLDWFYEQQLIDAEEFEQLQVLHSRPNKPDYEMYRVIWKNAGRSSPEVAAICTALRTGPQPGMKRGPKPAPAAASEAESEEPRPDPSPKAIAGWQKSLVAEREVELAEGGWVYCYTYEVMYRQAQALGEVPLLKVGHSSGHYTERIRTQVRGTEVPDSPVVLRAWRVGDSGRFESALHSMLKMAGGHHQSAGGAEWFRVRLEKLDILVEDVARSLQQLANQR